MCGGGWGGGGGCGRESKKSMWKSKNRTRIVMGWVGWMGTADSTPSLRTVTIVIPHNHLEFPNILFSIRNMPYGFNSTLKQAHTHDPNILLDTDRNVRKRVTGFGGVQTDRKGCQRVSVWCFVKSTKPNALQPVDKQQLNNTVEKHLSTNK